MIHKLLCLTAPYQTTVYPITVACNIQCTKSARMIHGQSGCDSIDTGSEATDRHMLAS